MLLSRLDATGYFCPNTMSHEDGPRYCKADDCFAWRWFDPAKRWEVIAPANETDTGEPIMEERPVPVEERRGYCGMAGPIEPRVR